MTVALIGLTLSLPLLLHEQSTRLSKANARLLRFADAAAGVKRVVSSRHGWQVEREAGLANQFS